MTKELEFFSTGFRSILMIHRKKDGGLNRPDYHAYRKISRNSEEFFKCIKELEILREKINPLYRIYCTVNERDINKAIMLFKHEIIDTETYNQEDKNRFYTDIQNRFFGLLQKPVCRKTKYFMYDIDVGEEIETKDDLYKITELIEKHTDILKIRETQNGFHIITAPFNHTVIDLEVKKDAITLIS